MFSDYVKKTFYNHQLLTFNIKVTSKRRYPCLQSSKTSPLFWLSNTSISVPSFYCIARSDSQSVHRILALLVSIDAIFLCIITISVNLFTTWYGRRSRRCLSASFPSGPLSEVNSVFAIWICPQKIVCVVPIHDSEIINLVSSEVKTKITSSIFYYFQVFLHNTSEASTIVST